MAKYIPVKQARRELLQKVESGVFVDLNAPSVRRLFKRDIEELEKVYGMKFYSHRDFVALNEQERAGQLQLISDVMSGKRIVDMYKTAGENYVKGIKNVLNDKDLSMRLENVLKAIGNDRNKLKAFYDKLPELNLYYKRSRKDGKTEGRQVTAEEIMEAYNETSRVIAMYEEKQFVKDYMNSIDAK